MSDVYVCISKQTCKTRGVWGHAPSGNVIDALRLLRKAFWGRSRAVVATWLLEYCLAVHVCSC